MLWQISILTVNNLDLLLAVGHYVINLDSLGRVNDQHLVYDVEQLGRVPRVAERLEVGRYYFLEQVVQRHLVGFVLERVVESTELVADAAQAPDVAFEVVAAAL